MLGGPGFKGIDFTGHDPYTLKFDELKKIVGRVKKRVFNPKKEMEKIQKEME